MNQQAPFFGSQTMALCKGPSITPQTAYSPSLTVHSVSFTVVVVERSVPVPHMAVCTFFPQLVIDVFIFIRLRLFFVAPLVLHNILQKET